MRAEAPKKIVYLFGAGATHAELANLAKDPLSEAFKKKKGLLISDVSSRVMAQAVNKSSYLKDIIMVSSTSGSLNIELFISLIENSRICNWQKKTVYLKGLVEKDIKGIIKKEKSSFYLYKALLDLHNDNEFKKKEKLLGLISLNYDDVLDLAYKEIYRTKRPNYFFYPNDTEGIPLLKLHGSFNWDRININGRKRNIQIIPLGSNKSYIHAPYNFIWNKALEILIECDILRIVGCSLSQNDFHLIDLLFKAHLEKGAAFDIEVIGPDKVGRNIKNFLGFFPNVKPLNEIEQSLIPDAKPINPFKTWLAAKIRRAYGSRLPKTEYIKKVLK
ncbi:MAG: hypothetical protein NTY31_02210 [Candidatus Falkowbacteria bacterium]|nr:hypothetical protein [Candidatus Falkowbacteria bacterium]